MSSAQLAAQLQALEFKMNEYVNFYFNHALMSTCRSMVQMVEILKADILANPTLTMRGILNRSDVYARAGGNAVEIFPCHFLEPDQVKIKPMYDPIAEELQ